MKIKNVPLISYIITILISISLTLGNLTTAYAAPQPKLLFGIGTEAIDAIKTPIVKDAPVKMLTSWYNGPNDLNWMDDSWHTSFIADSYAKGYTHHVITYSNDSEANFNSSKGAACGRQYPVSSQYVTDVEKLAKIYKGNGPLYITLMTEFQSYTCQDNQWQGNENYYNALKSNYLLTMQKIRQANPNAKVSIGWGGWQTRFDNPSKGSGRSFIPYFNDIMDQSQFQSFQAMQSDSNVQDIREMTKILGAHGPVMLAHYKPDNSSQSTFEKDVRDILTDSYIQEMNGYGLFAMSFMDKSNMSNSASIYTFIKDAINKYASTSAPSVTPLATVKPSLTPSPTIKPTALPTASTIPSATAQPSATVQSSPAVQGAYKGEYFNNRDLAGTPTVVRNDTNVNFNWIMEAPAQGVQTDNFSVRWTKQQQFESAEYTFSTLSDDGIRLYVDNEPLINQWNDHEETTHTAKKTMTAGTHDIRIEFYDSMYHAVAQAKIEKTGTASTLAPSPTSTPAPTVLASVAPTNGSKIQVLAAGTPAAGIYPTLSLVINGTKVATFDNIKGNPTSRTFQEFVYTAQSTIKGTIRLEYSNNGSAGVEDRNAFVDKIIVDGVTYETESPAVYSVGSWNQAAGCGGGNKQSEKLHCNGYFQYDVK